MGTMQGPLPIGVFLALLILACANAHPQCNIQCHGSPGQVLTYQQGSNYRYKLEGQTVTKIVGSNEEAAKLSISAFADVTAQPNCGYYLQLSNVHITGEGGKKYTDAAELESRPIRFGMSNGKLSDDLCTDPSESATSLNIKRAIISLLQSSNAKESGTSSHSETDIFGTCPTGFHYHKSANGLTVKKTKDLTRCAHREDLHVPLLSTPYVAHSDVQSTPFMSANYEAEQLIVDGIIKSAKSKEKYNYNPLDDLESGIKTTVETTLTFVTKGAGIAAGAGNVRKSVIFDAPHDKETGGTAAEILSDLKEACNRVEPSVPKDGAKHYSDLVRAFSRATKQEIMQIYNAVKQGDGFNNKELAHKMFMDALMDTETSARIEVVVELLKKGDIKGMEAEIWKMIAGFVKHVSPSALKAVTSLLDSDSTKYAYLGAGIVGGKFCREHNCENSAEIVELQTKLAKPLITGCTRKTLADEDLLVASIKGVGNVRYLTPVVAEKLALCAANKKARNRVRSAALDAIRMDPKKSDLKTTATNILKDVREDSELRIKAYLVLVECPCGKTAATIKEILDQEPINQVGAYIVSHLRNLRSSTNPDKALAKYHFGNIMTTKRFPFDVRKFSQNHEMSYLLETINLGASAESDVIYSQQSFLPRSIGLNLTTNIFGRSYNWFEMNARFENLDRVMAKYFGPKGYFNIHEPDDIVSEGQKNYEGFVENVQGKYSHSTRATRSVSRAQLEALDQQMKKNPHINDKEVLVDLSLKTEGADLLFLNFHGSDGYPNTDPLIDRAFEELATTMENAKDINVDYSQSFSLINAHLNYPTGMGLTLKLKVLGTVATRLKVDGKIDLNAIMYDPANADFNLQMIPSGALDISGTVSIDGTLVERGVRLGATVHSATGTDISIRLLDGKGFDVKLGVPLEKTEIINAQAELVNIVREKGHPEVATPVVFKDKPESYDIQFDQLQHALGLKFCAHASALPLAGTTFGIPTSFSLWIERDPDLTYYQMKFFLDANEDTHNLHLDVLLDTPNTMTDRKMNLMVNMGMHPKPFFTASAKVPWISATFEGKLVENAKEKLVTAKLLLAESEYSVKAGVKISGREPSVKYEPFLEYKAPGSEPSSKLIGRKGSKQVQPSNYFSGSVLVTSEGMKTIYKIDKLTLHTPAEVFTANGQIVRDTNYFMSDVKIGYSSEEIAISGKLDFTHPNNPRVSFGYIMSAYPDLGITFNWNIDSETKETDEVEIEKYDSLITLVHGPDPHNEQSKITLKNYHSFTEGPGNHREYISKNHFTYPLLSLESVFDWTVTDLSLHFVWKEANMLFDFNNQLTAKTEKRESLDYDIHFNADLLIHSSEQKYSIDAKLKHDLLSDDKSKFANSLAFHTGDKYELNAVVIHKFDDIDDYHFNVDCDIHLPIKTPHWKVQADMKEHANEMSGYLKLTGGQKKQLDFAYTLKETPDPSGSYHLIVSDILKTEGRFAHTQTKFDGNWEFEFLKYNKKMDAKANIAMRGNNYNGFVEFCWDTKNRVKTLKINTNTMIDDNEYSTNNTIHFKDKVTKLNLMGKTTKESDKSGSCVGMIEVVLPNTRHVAAKMEHSYVTEPGDHEGEYIIHLRDWERAGADPTDILFKLIGKNIDWNKEQFDGQAALTYTDSHQKNLMAQATLKKMPTQSKDKWTINGQFDVKGSLIEHPMKMTLESEVSNLWLEGELNPDNTFPPVWYRMSGTVGTSHQWNANGKLNGHLATGEFTVKLPESQPVHHFKWTTNNEFFLPIDVDSDHFKWVAKNDFAWNGNKFFKSSWDATEEEHGGKIKFSWESDSVAKRSIELSGHAKETAGVDHIDFSISHDLVEGKNAHLGVTAELKDSEYLNLHLKGSSHENVKYDILLKNKAIKAGEGVHSELTATIGKEKYSGSSKIEFHDNQMLFDVVFDDSHGKSSALLKTVRKGEKHFTVDVKLKWPGEPAGSFMYDTEMNVASFDNLFIKTNIDSAAFGLDKFQFNLKTGAAAKGGAKKGPQGGNAISFSGKNAGKNVFSGSMNYHVKHTDTGAIYKGTGNLKIEDKAHPISFEAIQNSREDGEEFKLDIASGKKNFKVDYRKNHNELKLQRTYCKEGDQQCSTARVHLFRKSDGEGTREAKIDILLDFSLMARNLHDLSFVAHSKVTPTIIEDTHISLQWSPEGKLSYREYIKENEAGLIIVTPHRTIEGHVTYEEPHKSHDHWSHEVKANFWLDKVRHPDHKLSFVHTGGEKNNVFEWVASISHPALERPMQISFVADVSHPHDLNAKGLIDVFAQKSQAIHIDHKTTVADSDYDSKTTIKSTGCALDITFHSEASFDNKTSGWFWINKLSYVDSTGASRLSEASIINKPREFNAKVSIPEMVIFDSQIKVTENPDNDLTMTARESILGSVYEQHLHMYMKTKSLKWKLEFKQHGAKKVLDVFVDVIHKTVEVHFNTKKLVKIYVSNTDIKYVDPLNNQVLDELIETATKEVQEWNKHWEHAAKSMVNRWSADAEFYADKFIKALPDMTHAWEDYAQHVAEITQEILSDPYLSPLFQKVNEVLTVFIEVAVTTGEQMVTFYNHHMGMFLESFKSLVEVINTSVPPILQSAAETQAVIISIVEEWIRFANEVATLTIEQLKEYEEEARVVIDTVNRLMEELNHFAASAVEAVFKVYEDTLIQVYSVVKEMIDEINIQEKLTELTGGVDINFAIASMLDEISVQIADSCEEPLCQFVVNLINYIAKILRHEDFNKAEAEEILNKQWEETVNSLSSLLETPSDDSAWVKVIDSFFDSSDLSLDKLPSGDWRFSVVEWLLSADLPSFEEILKNYNFLNILDPWALIPPFPASGVLIGGGEIVTFDGRHVALRGTCSYLLAKDVVDGQFSLVADMAGGQIQSVTLFDEHHHSIEIRHHKKPLLNGKETEYLVKTDEMKAWRNPNGYGMYLNGGVLVECDDAFSFCTVRLSGFFHNKVRGILGNPNYEPYDDTATINNKVTKDFAEFLNSWKVDAACPSLPAVPVAAPHREKLCTDFFSESEHSVGNLELCFYSIPAEPYRTACDRLVKEASGAEAKRTAACKVASAYAQTCRLRGNPFSMIPDECVVCHIGNEKLAEGEFHTVKTGNKMADVVFVVELNKKVEPLFKQLLVPLTETLTKSYKDQGITDVKYAVVGYGGSAGKTWPAYFTNNGNMEFLGHADHIKFEEDHPTQEYSHAVQWKNIESAFNEIIGNTPKHGAHESILQFFSFRPEAVKTVIGLDSNICGFGQVLNVLRTLVNFKWYEVMGVTTSYVYPFKAHMENQKSKIVVGFDDDDVYTTDSGKSKPLKGHANKADDLEFERDGDACVLYSQSTGGNVFAGGNFLEAGPGQKKQFMSVMSQMIVETSTRHTNTLECTCSVTLNFLRPRSYCIVEDSDENPKGRSQDFKTKGGVKGGAKG